VTKTFSTPEHKYNVTTKLLVRVSERAPLPLPPETLGDRVRFQIVRISKKGAVTVKVKPKVMNTLLTR
jgi:hypothetical protein